MADNVVIYLPLSTYINVLGFTNASFLQQVTIVEENGTSHTMTGSGEHNTPMQNGSFGIQTPATSSNPMGYTVTVTIESQSSGTWNPSNVTSGKTSLMYYNIALVVSEDDTDQDWNDAVVQFCWWTAPEMRS